MGYSIKGLNEQIDNYSLPPIKIAKGLQIVLQQNRDDFAAKSELIDFESVFQILVDKQGWTSHRAKWAIAEYRRFLMLMLMYPNQKLVPSVLQDAVLHIHLDMESFSEDCRHLGFCFRHNAGFGSRGQADRRAWLRTCQKTKTLFKDAFGIEAMGTSSDAHCFTIATVSA